MNDAFILLQNSGPAPLERLQVSAWRPGWVRLRHPDWTPTTLIEAWYINPESPLLTAAQALSAQAGGLALAVLNLEQELLRLWAFRQGELVFEYDSNPSYATCTVTSPEFGGVDRLAAAFGLPEQRAALEKLLSRHKGLGFINESGRLALLLDGLGLAPLPNPA